MYLIYIDESGYSDDWSSDKNLENHPYFVMSAVAFETTHVVEAFDSLANDFDEIGIPHIKGDELGDGKEIKGKEISRGRGYWGRNTEDRNLVRDIYLGLPSRFEAECFLTVIDTKRHYEKYSLPTRPDFLALQYILERVQRFLEEVDSYGVIIYDQNKFLEDRHAEFISQQVTEGSSVMYNSEAYGCIVSKTIKVTRVVEYVFGKSEYSLGLQVADFYANHANVWLGSGRSADCGWWDLVWKSLKTSENTPIGYGYKEFPDIC